MACSPVWSARRDGRVRWVRAPQAPQPIARWPSARWARPDVLALVLIVAANVAVSWRFVPDGGLFFDDWWLRAEQLYGTEAERVSFWAGLGNLSDAIGYRPTSVPMYGLAHSLGGGEPLFYTLFAFVNSVLVSAALYLALRVARMPVLGAGIAALVLAVAPFAGSVRFWMSASLINFAIALLLIGLVTGALSLREPRGSRTVALGVLSVACLLTAALTYEATAAVGGLSLLYYAVARGRFARQDVKKAAVDVGALIAGLLVFRTAARTDVAPADSYIEHAKTIVGDAYSLLAAAAVPDGRWGTVFLLALAGIGAALLLRLVLVRPTLRELTAGESAGELRRWTLWGIGGVGVALAGYLLYVPADAFYRPAQTGQGDRVNAMATVGFAVALAAMVMWFGALGTLVAARPRVPSLVIAAILAVLVGGALAGQTRGKGDLYISSFAEQERFLDGLQEAVPRSLRHGSTILTFGAPGYVAPNIPSFGETWDLNGAARLALRDGSIRAFPILAGQEVRCASAGVALPLNPARPPLYGEGYEMRYGEVIFVDPVVRSSQVIDGARECRGALTRFVPGPYYAAL